MVTHDYSCRTGKVFLSQPEASVDQRSVSANPRPRLPLFPPSLVLLLAPVAIVSLATPRGAAFHCRVPSA